VTHEHRMLIDGKLVESETGRQFDNINPATEEVLGGAADGTRVDMERGVFGPVLSVIGFDHDDDAVRIANDSIYGLSGVIFANDLERAKNVAARIRTGTLGINGGLWYGADAPFGGYKQSGIGRQCGIEGLEIFTETKTVGWPAS
jgi:aldehyde dehydrogenase (NAD+)